MPDAKAVPSIGFRAVMKQNWEPELKYAILRLWEVGVDLLEEDKARELFFEAAPENTGQGVPFG